MAGTKIEAGLETLIVPVNPMPTARVILAAEPAGRRQGQATTRGGIELQSDQSLVGRLGPADQIEIRWPGLMSVPSERSTAAVEAQILWDINPAGDRVRARFSYNQPGELSTIKLNHEPGLILRSTQVPGSADAFWEEVRGEDQWTLRIDPPLKGGSTIAVDCWRPLDDRRGKAGCGGGGGRASRPPGPPAPSSSACRCRALLRIAGCPQAWGLGRAIRSSRRQRADER